MPDKFSSVVLLRSPARFTPGQFLDRLRHLTAPVGKSTDDAKERTNGHSVIASDCDEKKRYLECYLANFRK